VAASFWLRLVDGHTPPANTPRYAQVYRRAFVGVICLTLLYNVGMKYHSIARTPNFYDVLSVPYNCTTRELKVRMGKLSLLYHPDKGGDADVDRFVRLRFAYDVLADPVNRHHYDRLGPSVTEPSYLTELQRNKEGSIVEAWFSRTTTYYKMWLLMLVGMSFVLGWGVTGWWGTLLTISTGVFEVLQITGSSPLRTFPLVGPLLVFEQVELMRTALETVLGALIQLGLKVPAGHAPCTAAELETKLDAVLQLSTIVEGEALVMQATEFQPFAGDSAAPKELERKMADWLVQRHIRNTPAMRNALADARKRR